MSAVPFITDIKQVLMKSPPWSCTKECGCYVCCFPILNPRSVHLAVRKPLFVGLSLGSGSHYCTQSAVHNQQALFSTPTHYETKYTRLYLKSHLSYPR